MQADKNFNEMDVGYKDKDDDSEKRHQYFNELRELGLSESTSEELAKWLCRNPIKI